MRLSRYILLALPVMLFSSCEKNSNSENLPPSNRLLVQLEDMIDDGIMLGHQDDLAYGSMWYGIPGGSDMNGVSGDYPAVFGWDISNVEIGGELNPDSVRIDKIKDYIAAADSMGSISTVRWSAAPIDGAENCLISSVLPGGENNSLYAGYLDNVAAFLKSLKDSKGNEIPVIFQPLSCPNDDCNWWCKEEGDIDAYKKVWAYTVDYLRQHAGVDNALFAFSLASPLSLDEWKLYYPGDEYVDIMGVDFIADSTEPIETFDHDFVASIGTLSRFANEHHKLPAVTATGMAGIKTPGFFSRHMANALSQQHLSFVMLWKNSWKEEDYYFVPLKGHPMADDFNDFVASDFILTCSNLANMEH